MALDKEAIREALTKVRHPGFGTDLVEAGAVAKVAWCDGYASLRIAGGGLSDLQRSALVPAVQGAVRALGRERGEAIADVHVEVTDDAPAGALAARAAGAVRGDPRGVEGAGGAEAGNALPRVGHIIAVGAGKGGVGKSTVAVNLAVGLARRGHAVGLLDADIYGPSLPTMLGLQAMEVVTREKMIQPMYVHGVKAMTIGKLVDAERPLIWRGPMAHSAFKQLAEQTEWGELDYLIIDLPPGTGDVNLTMAQLLKLSGAVVVCTPQKVAQDDAVRAARMFQQLNIPVLGVVENMSYFLADDVDPPREYDLFGRGGAERMAQRLGVPFLGAIPITIALRENSDKGDPTANFAGASGGGGAGGRALARALEAMVSNVSAQASLAAVGMGKTRPTLKIS